MIPRASSGSQFNRQTVQADVKRLLGIVWFLSDCVNDPRPISDTRWKYLHYLICRAEKSLVTSSYAPKIWAWLAKRNGELNTVKYARK